MLKKEDRIKTVYVTYGDVIQIQYIHKCKDCDTEMSKTSWEEKNNTGYCYRCSLKYKKRTILYNEKGEKFCKACNRHLPSNKFIKRKDTKTPTGKISHSTLCSKCHNLRKFGITSLDYELLHKNQDGKCAICGLPEMVNDKNKNTPRALAVDHCHKSTKVRGLLCTKCNNAIGGFKDNIEILKKAILYLQG